MLALPEHPLSNGAVPRSAQAPSAMSPHVESEEHTLVQTPHTQVEEPVQSVSARQMASQFVSPP
jgi:hypothetical protein